MNEPENRELQLPWMNVHTNASSLARMYAALSLGGEIDGVRLVRPEAITPLHATQSWSNMDRVLQKPLGFSQGFQKEERHLFSPEGSWFGHPGAGGSLGYADPQNQIAFAYVINGLSPYIRSPRAIALSQAVYRCLGIL
jgi:CubicO group peptidase (beta-lactamase class C family)